MVEVKKDISVVCLLEGDSELYFIRLDLMSLDEVISTLEFAEITNEVNDILAINKEISLYEDEEEIKHDGARR